MLLVDGLSAAAHHVTGPLFASVSADSRLSLWRLEVEIDAEAFGGSVALPCTTSLIVGVDNPLALDVVVLVDGGGVVFAVAGAGLQTVYFPPATVMAYAAGCTAI
jgi:hypothetical protein